MITPITSHLLLFYYKLYINQNSYIFPNKWPSFKSNNNFILFELHIIIADFLVIAPPPSLPPCGPLSKQQRDQISSLIPIFFNFTPLFYIITALLEPPSSEPSPLLTL